MFSSSKPQLFPFTLVVHELPHMEWGKRENTKHWDHRTKPESSHFTISWTSKAGWCEGTALSSSIIPHTLKPQLQRRKYKQTILIFPFSPHLRYISILHIHSWCCGHPQLPAHFPHAAAAHCSLTGWRGRKKASPRTSRTQVKADFSSP